MSTSADAHDWCINALPSWLDGTLAADAAAALAAHVRDCAECRGELEIARRVRAQFDQDWRDVAPLLATDHEQAQFDALWARITDAAGESTPLAPKRRRAPVWSALAATLLFATGVAWYHGAAAPEFRTLADRPPQRCTALRVEVNGAATDAVRRALLSTGVTIVDARSAGATFVLTAANPADALIALRALPEVRLAEPIDC